MASMLVPVAYIIVVFGSLLLFIHYYRQHMASKIVEPYFPPHVERNTYITLLQKTNPPASDALLKAALLRRAVADVKRVIRVREDKSALQVLVGKGCVGDDLWTSLLAAEKELEAEIVEVVGEANSFVEGWGQIIFPTANEVIANEKIRQVFEQTAQVKAELEIRYDVRASYVTEPVNVILGHGQAPTAIPPATPTTPALNGLLPPQTPISGDSDGESVASPRRGSKNSKKGKKRK
ncbi:translocation protein sec66 [Mycena floridula]|nr:translocation protein sec66 [Mycena floridula]